MSDETAAAPTPLAPAVLRARLGGSPCLVLLDVDGTLAPIAPRPELARVPDATRAALATLVGQAGVVVALVSGRAAADALRLAGVDGVWVIGNHGAELRRPDGAEEVDPRVAAWAPALARARAALAPLGLDVPGVLVEDKRWSLSVHVRLAPPDAVPRVEDAVRRVAGAEGLRVATGKAVLELRAPVDVHKGSAVLALVERLGGGRPAASVLFAGDDVTDEDAFRALRGAHPHALTVRVGEPAEPTAAELVVASTEALRESLEALAALRAGLAVPERTRGRPG